MDLFINFQKTYNPI